MRLPEQVVDISHDSSVHYRSKLLLGRMLSAGLLAIYAAAVAAKIAWQGPRAFTAPEYGVLVAFVAFLTWYLTSYTARGPVEVRISSDQVVFWNQRGRPVCSFGPHGRRQVRMVDRSWEKELPSGNRLPDARYFLSRSARRIALSEEAFWSIQRCFRYWEIPSRLRQRTIPGVGVETVYEYYRVQGRA